MHDAFSSPSQIHQFYLSSYLSGNTDFTVGNNPILPAIIKKTWTWPCFSVVFEIDETPVAYFSAFKISNIWISLPHFSYSSLWLNYSFIVAGLKSNRLEIPSCEQCSQRFFNRFINQLPVNPVNDGNPAKVSVVLTDLLTDVPLNEKSENLISRNQLKLAQHYNTSKVLSLLSLKQSMDEQMTELSSNLRRKIRKAKTNGISVTKGGIELLPAFYKIYRKEIHRHGSFGVPIAFFRNLIDDYSFGKVSVFLANHNGKIVGSSIMMTYLGYSENPAFATEPESNRMYSSYSLHNAMIQAAIEEGCHTYSFGHSTNGSSVHKYKQQWNTFDKPIFLNSTYPIKSLVVKYQFLLPIIKLIPLRLISLFDSYISKKIY
jgi:hypothetical protein